MGMTLDEARLRIPKRSLPDFWVGDLEKTHLKTDATHKKAQEYLSGMEKLAGRLDAAFPAGQFDDAKATLKDNITQMMKELAGKPGK